MKADLVIYIQCDARYNKYLMKEIEGKTVSEYAVSNAKNIGSGHTMLSCMFDCVENRTLGKILKSLGVNVKYSDEEHVNKRFINSVIDRKEKYVVRVAGDQLLLNSGLMTDIVQEMEQGDYEFFYPELSASKLSGSAIAADMVQISVLQKYYDDVITAGRYFHPLCMKREIKRYRLQLPQLFFPCRANCDEGFYFSQKVIENHLNVLELQRGLIERLSSDRSDLRKTGMWRSWLLGNVCDFFYDANGDVNPWWCESAVDLTKRKILHTPDIRIFEWGAGNSTLFWAHYAKEVVSVESNLDWYQKMKSLVPANVRIEYRELVYGGDYGKVILDEEENFDIVVIDGRDRVRCAKNCLGKLKEDGIIIWDNTDRDYYEEGYRYLKDNGFKQLELSGITWGLPGVRDYTSIFYRNSNMWGL